MPSGWDLPNLGLAALFDNELLGKWIDQLGVAALMALCMSCMPASAVVANLMGWSWRAVFVLIERPDPVCHTNAEAT